MHRQTVRRHLSVLATILLGFLAGALTLSGLSLLQKKVAAYPLLPDGFIIPFFVGGLVGATLTVQRLRIKELQQHNTVVGTGQGQISQWLWSVLCLGLGALVLVAFSTLQKVMAGYPLAPKGYFVPIIFGSSTGYLIGLYILRLHQTQQAQIQAYQALENTQNFLQAIFQSVEDGLVALDGQGRITRANPAACQLLHSSEHTMLGHRLHDILKPQLAAGSPSCPRFDQALTHVAVVEPPHSKQQQHLKIKTAPLDQHNDANMGWIATLHDISEEKRIDELKSEFLATAAHELRTPITAMAGYSELLNEGPQVSAQQQQEFLHHIHEKSWQLSRTVDNLLDLSRVERGKMLELEISRFSVDQLLAPFQEEEPPYSSSKHRFIFDLKGSHVELQGDIQRLQQVLDNLYSNALKFSPQGGTITTRGWGENGSYCLAVQDPGIGMSPVQQEHIFDTFYRGNPSDSGAGGTGLGMSLVKVIMDAHQGQIDIHSEQGQGTTITLKLPLPHGVSTEESP